MSAILAVTRAGPLTTIQDLGRFGLFRHGISASGPMDQTSFIQAGLGGAGGIEITMAGVEIQVRQGTCRVRLGGGLFKAKRNGKRVAWPGEINLAIGDTLAVTPGGQGNYGYLRFDADIAVPRVMGSVATSSRARLGGLDGRPLRAGDVIALGDEATGQRGEAMPLPGGGPIRFVWGLHAEAFSPAVRDSLLAGAFKVSAQMDRMGVRLEDVDQVFANATVLSLVSDAIVAGDIQILGDGTPIVLMRDHQPTGGYPRIGTIITADIDRFAQLRPGSTLGFAAVSPAHARDLLREGRR